MAKKCGRIANAVLRVFSSDVIKTPAQCEEAIERYRNWRKNPTTDWESGYKSLQHVLSISIQSRHQHKVK